jgi:hypothetical protein
MNKSGLCYYRSEKNLLFCLKLDQKANTIQELSCGLLNISRRKGQENRESEFLKKTSFFIQFLLTHIVYDAVLRQYLVYRAVLEQYLFTLLLFQAKYRCSENFLLYQ